MSLEAYSMIFTTRAAHAGDWISSLQSPYRVAQKHSERRGELWTQERFHHVSRACGQLDDLFMISMLFLSGAAFRATVNLP